MASRHLIVGFIGSLAIHGLLLYPWSKPESPERCKTTALALPAEAVDRTEQPAKPQPVKQRQTAPMPPPSSIPDLARVADSSGADMGAGDWSDSKIAENILPRLRITWQSSEDLRKVAYSLGMKIVAVDDEARILGEVAVDGALRVTPFSGRLGDYSNRVRTLPADFFGSNLEASAQDGICSLWILVPAALDRQFVQTLKDAIRERGIQPARVGTVEARFVGTRSGNYELVVTEVRSLS